MEIGFSEGLNNLTCIIFCHKLNAHSLSGTSVESFEAAFIRWFLQFS